MNISDTRAKEALLHKENALKELLANKDASVLKQRLQSKDVRKKERRLIHRAINRLTVQSA